MNRVYQFGCLAPTMNAERVHTQIRLAHRYRNQLVEIERARRAALREPGVDKERVAVLAAELRRGARALCGCHWGTYQLIEEADRQARGSKSEPHFVRWDGNGQVSCQIMQGMASHEFGDDRRVRLTTPNERGHAVLSLRVGSNGREPVWAEWPIILHRPFPAGVRIKRVTVSMRRDGRRTRWSAEFSIDMPAVIKSCGQGAVGVDLGWRMIDGAERVCTYASEDGKDEGDLRLSKHALAGIDRVHSLQATRDQLLNELRAHLREYRDDSASAVFVDRTTHMHAWRSPGQYVRLLRELRASDTDAQAVSLLEAWKYRNVHLWDWQSGQNRRNLNQRREQYRLFANSLAKKYETLVLERFDLRTFAKCPSKDAPRGPDGRSESHQEEKARAQRHKGATSILRSILRNAFERRGGQVVEVSAVDTTRTCNACGLVMDRDFAASIDWTCDCGAVHDQDVNAADNLCERWRKQLPPGGARIPNAAKGTGKKEGAWARRKRERIEKVTARNAVDKAAE